MISRAHTLLDGTRPANSSVSAHPERSAEPSLSGSAISVAKATTPSRPSCTSTALGSWGAMTDSLVSSVPRHSARRLTRMPTREPLHGGEGPLSIASLREEYRLGGLDESELTADPLDLLQAWLDDAVRAGLYDPTAMVLSTVSAAGPPCSRMGLLKG